LGRTTGSDQNIPAAIAKQLTDPAAYGESVALHDQLKWLRANQPLGRAEVPGFDPFWVVTKHADILEVSRQQAVFRNGDRPTVLIDQASEQFVRRMTGSPHLIKSIVQMDAPEHPKYRSITQSWFLPSSVKRLEERIRVIARAQVDKMIALGSQSDGHCDFVRDVAHTYPLHVIMEILGVPPEDERRLLMLTQELFGSQDPDLNRGRQKMADPAEITKQLAAVVADFSEYFRKVTVDRRANPRDDIATVIAQSQVDGRPISDIEAMGYYILIAAAGHDTTSSSTSGAMWALCSDPAEFSRVKVNPTLIQGLVEEAVRWTTPTQHFMRSAGADYSLRGQTIAKDDWLMLSYLSGNRDEEVFDEPFKFRIDRSPNRHLAFGNGVHSCLGQHLARLEMRVLFEELLPKLETVELTGEPKRSCSTFVSGPKTLPMRFTLRS